MNLQERRCKLICHNTENVGLELEAGCGGGRKVECGESETEFKSGAMVITWHLH